MPNSISSNTTTYNALQSKPLMTRPEFKHEYTRYMTQYQQASCLIIHHFIQLWTPKSNKEWTNFVPDMNIFPPKVEFSLPSKRVPIANINPQIFHPKLSQGKSQNLSYIAFFNYIFDKQSNTGELFACQSPTTQQWYFVQNPSFYLKTYFQEVYRHKMLGVPHPQLYAKVPKKDEIQNGMLKIIDPETPWWTSLFSMHSTEDIKRIFTKELFEVYLRISLTPDVLIQSIAELYLKMLHPYDQRYFITYLLSLAGMIRKTFLKLLNAEDNQNWRLYLENESENSYQRFVEEIHRAPHNYYNIPFVFSIIQAKAFRLKIPHLVQDCRHPKIDNYPYLVQVEAIFYLIHLMQTDWKNLQYDSKHIYWSDLTALIKELKSPSLIIVHNHLPFMGVLLLRAIQYHHHDIAKFILYQNGSLKYESHIFFDPKDYRSKILNGGSTLLVALYYENKVISHLLTYNQIRLSTKDELKFIDLLMESFSSDQTERASFLLNEYLYIFKGSTLQRNQQFQAILAESSAAIRSIFEEAQLRYQESPQTQNHSLIRQRRASFFANLNSTDDNSTYMRVAKGTY